MLQSGWAQNFVFALCSLGSSGMWNALNTMGSFGTSSNELGHTVNLISAVSSTIFGLFAGSTINLLGVPLGCCIGLLGTASILFGTHMYWFLGWIPFWAVALIIALGSAALPIYFSALGAALMQYATDKERPAFITMNSVLLNIGGLGGAVMALALNWNIDADASPELSPASHRILTLIPLIPVLLCIFLRPANTVKRSDGTMVELREVSLKDEMRGLKGGLTDTYLWLIALYAFVQMWHEVWLYNWINIQVFDVRGRCFNALTYYVGRIFWAVIYNLVISRPGTFAQKAYRGFGLNAAIYAVATICVFFRAFNWIGLGELTGANLTIGKSWIFTAAFFLFGGIETINFNHSNWVIGSLPLDMSHASRYAGWIRALNSLGMGLPWALDLGHAVPYWVQWLLHTVGSCTSFGLAWMLVKKMERALTNKDTSDVCFEELESHTELLTTESHLKDKLFPSICDKDSPATCETV